MQKIVAAVLVLAVLSGAVGCKKKTVEEPEAVGSAGSIVVVEDTAEIKLAAANVSTLNPLETTSKSVQSIMNTVYEPLFTVDEKLNIVPVLAESYSLSEDGMRITVKLADGIKWHDGTPFTAEDVLYTWDRLKDSNGLYKGTAKKIGSVTLLSEKEVEFGLLAQELDFAYYLTFPILSRNTNYLVDLEFVPIGTGAYKYGGKSENEIVLEPNTAWRGELKAQRKILVKLLRDNNEALQAFNVNETDAILSEDTENLETPPKSSAQIKKIVSENMVFLGFNTMNPQLTREVRCAIGMTLDKPKLLEKAAYGYGRVCDISINPDSWAYEGIETDEYSWEYVSKMLENAGYTMKNNVYSKEDQKLELEILVSADKPQRVVLAEAISEALTGAGFATRVNALDFDAYLERIKNGEFDMFLGVAQTDIAINPIALLDGESNYFNFYAGELVTLRNSLYGVTDKEEYKKTVKEIAARFKVNPPYIPLFFTTCGVYYGSNVSGITEPTLTDRYKNIEKWYFYNNTQNEDKKSE